MKRGVVLVVHRVREGHLRRSQWGWISQKAIDEGLAAREIRILIRSIIADGRRVRILFKMNA